MKQEAITKERLIVEAKNLPMVDALRYAARVVKLGRTRRSGPKRELVYCWMTTFQVNESEEIVVHTINNLRSQRLVVTKQPAPARGREKE
jgi:hypothetical protein